MSGLLFRFEESYHKLYDKYGKQLHLVSLISFYIGITLEIFYVLWDKSEFIVPSEGILFRISFVFFFLSLVTTKYSIREWIAVCGMCVLGVLSWKMSSRNDMLRIVVLCAACKDKEIRVVLKYTFWTTLAGCISIVLLALTGILGEVSKTEEFRENLIETRYVFGMGHPNAFHCMFFALVLLGMYLWFERLKWYALLILFLANYCLYVYTDSNTGFITTAFAICFTFIIRYGKKLRELKAIYVIGIVGILLMVAFSLGVAYYGYIYNYNGLWEEPHFWTIKAIDRFFNGRLWSAYGYPDSHMEHFKLFSQAANVRYMDMGFYRLFYWYGYVPGILYTLGSCYLVWRAYKDKNYALFIFVIPWSIYNLWEAHAISDYIGRNYMYLMWGASWASCSGSILRRKQ